MHSLNVRTSSAREYDTQNEQYWVIFGFDDRLET